ncbi:DUF4367 domain-containing protein [Brevibacillus ruminantium]|uniref:DUF4367 domain-containing protein n=1 Tax=Brevibacillus ruminantium TaxID=2950604 RepID=A0ABY4WIA5_9BACL|nr:DUF4367 domain-containing protein [Brevibacillus ruminantium]USG66434.1 DUF4367 domain-containing protein [Brevibacillus ruminantium]
MFDQEQALSQLLRQKSKDFTVSPRLKNRIMASVMAVQADQMAAQAAQADLPTRSLPPAQADRADATRHRVPSGRTASRKTNAGKPLLAMVSLLVLMITSGFVVLKYLEIKNEAGETVLSYQEARPLSAEKIEELKAKQATIDQLRSTLQPGTAAAVYQAKDENGQPQYFYIQNPLVVNNLDALKERLGPDLRTPAEKIDGYRFSQATLFIGYELDDSQMAVMAAEAQEQNKEYVIRPVPMRSDITSVSITYENDAGQILFLNARHQEGQGRIVLPAVHEQSEQVLIHGSEGIYLEYLHPEGGKRKILEWLQAGSNWLLSLTTADGFSKDDLIRIAESISARKISSR